MFFVLALYNLGLSKSNYPCHFVCGCVLGIVRSYRWTTERSSLLMTKDNLGNMINRDIAPRVDHCSSDG